MHVQSVRDARLVSHRNRRWLKLYFFALRASQYAKGDTANRERAGAHTLASMHAL